MKKLLLILLISIQQITFSQKKDIEFTTKLKGNQITFICLNNSDLKQEVILEFTKAEGLKGNINKPIKYVVDAKTDKTFVTLSITGKYSYKTSYTYIPFYSSLEKNENQEIPDNFKKGIIVFSKKGCSRCKSTKDFLKKNKIEYTYLNTTDNKENNTLLWKVLKRNNFKGKSIMMPIILVEGKMYKNIKNFNFLSDYIKK